MPATVPENKKLPAVRLSQTVKNVASSEPAILLQDISASEVKPPVEAALKETDLRVVSVAGFVVPAEPGSPMCSFT